MGHPPAIDDAHAHADALLAMAEHFLDTETRHLLPYTAHACVLAGLDPEQVRSLWHEDIAPVVGINLLSPAGEWAGWNGDWLLQRIRERRTRGHTWWGRWRNRWSRRLLPVNRGDLEALSRFVAALSEASDPVLRDQMLADMQWLGRCFLGMTMDAPEPSAADRQRLLHCYEASFKSALAPALLDDESNVGAQRVRAVLASHG